MPNFCFSAKPLINHLFLSLFVIMLLTSCDSNPAYIDRGYVPVADAGEDQTITRSGEAVTLDASDSFDKEGGALSYRWLLIEKPEGSETQLLGASFVPDMDGVYVFQLVVNNGTTDSKPDTVTITVGTVVVPENSKPVANAGDNQNSKVGTLVILNGEQSSDPDNDAISYQWSLTKKPEDSLSTLNSANQSLTNFTPDLSGKYIAQLLVNDGKMSSEPDYIIITVESTGESNQPPTAKAGADKSVLVGDAVTLTAIDSSDSDGQIVSYEWRKSGTTLSTQIEFTKNDFSVGVHNITLTVIDDDGQSAVDTIIVKVNNKNTPNNNAPTVSAGGNQVITKGDSVSFTATANDTDGTIERYEWKESSTILSTENSFTKSDFNVGSHLITLTVTDNDGASATDTITITVKKKIVIENKAPTISVGGNKTITKGEPVTLNAIANDSDGIIANQQWTEGTQIMGDQLALTLNNLSVGSHTFTITVTDNDGATATATVIISVKEKNTQNKAPTVDAGNDKEVIKGKPVTLNAKANDPDGIISSYIWKKGNNILGESQGLALNNLELGKHIFEITVTDNENTSAIDTIEITIIEDDVLSGSLSGKVIDQKGVIIVNAKVSLATGETVVSNSRGIYKFSKVLETERTTVTASRNSFLQNSEIIKIESGKETLQNLILSIPKKIATIKPDKDEIITTQGMTIELPKDGFVDKNGDKVDEELSLSATYFPITTEEGENEFPGDLKAERADGETGELTSFGFIKLDLKDKDGNDVEVAPGQEIQLSIPADDALDKPATIPFWSFDEEKGLWVEEGVATYDPETNTYKTAVSSVNRAFNLDAFTDTREVFGSQEICVEDEDGNKVLANIIVEPENKAWRDLSKTSIDGLLKLDGLIANNRYNYYAATNNGSIGVYAQNPAYLQPLESGVNKLESCIIVKEGNKTQDVAITGTVVDTSGNPIPDVAITIFGTAEGLTFGEPGLVGITETTSDSKGKFGVIIDKSSLTALEVFLLGKDITIKVSNEGEAYKKILLDKGGNTFDAGNLVLSANQPPVANAGLDGILFLGGSVFLSYDLSYDPDIDDLIAHYEWREGDNIVATNKSYSSSSLSLGDHYFVLTVTDKFGLKASDEVKVSIVDTQKHLLFVDAGLQRSFYPGDSFASISLSNTETISVGSSISQVQWKEGEEILSEKNSVKLSDLSIGKHNITLLVKNKHGLEGSDQVVVTILESSEIIDAGIDKTIELGEYVSISPRYFAGRKNPNLVFTWTEEGSVLHVGTPSGIPFTTFNYTGAELGSHVLTLTVTDEGVVKFTDSLKVMVTSKKPLVPLFINAGDSKVIGLGETVNLNATGELPQYGNSFKWTEDGDVLSENKYFHYLGEEVGSHTITLTVANSITGQSETDEVIVIVKVLDEKEKNILKANAGVDKTIYLNDRIYIRGSYFSTSSFSGPYYSWYEGGTNISGGSSNSGNFEYEAKELGTHTIKLELSHSFGAGVTITDTDEIVINVVNKGSNTNIADLGPDQVAYVGGEVIIKRKSSEHVQHHSAKWEIDGIIKNSYSDNSILYVPTTIGEHIVKLTVTDDNGEIFTDTLKVFVSEPDFFLQAIAGKDIGISLGSSVQLKGNWNSVYRLNNLRSTPKLRGRWSENGLTLGTSFKLNYKPKESGVHRLKFEITENGRTDSDEVQIIVSPNTEEYLIADAGKDMVVYEGTDLMGNTIKGAQFSSNGISTYKWTEGEEVLSNQWYIREYTPIGIGEHILMFTVEDSQGNISTDEKIIMVIPDDRSPHVLANAGPDADMYLGGGTQLNSKSYFTSNFSIDRNYQWMEGDTILSTKSWFSYTSETLGKHTIKLVITDSKGRTDTDEVIVNVLENPRKVTANAGKDRIAYKGGKVSLVIYESYAINANIEKYSWQENGIVLSNKQAFDYTSDELGEHLITLTVKTYDGLSDSDDVVVKIVDDAKLDRIKPVITLIGDSEITINQGDIYLDQGATAIDDRDGVITESITSNSNGLFTTYITGTFRLTYRVSDKAGNSSSVVRTVIIKESLESDVIPPVITLIGENPVSQMQGLDYNDTGITVLDNRDGDLGYSFTNNVDINIPGRYEVVYTAKDTAGNTSTIIRVVNILRDPNIVIDTTKPVITLKGEPIISLVEGSTYTDEGATATDNIDGDISNQITTTNPVDTSIVKEYLVTYKVKDKVGNEAVKTRTVNITKKPDAPDTLPPLLGKSLEWLETQAQADGAYTNSLKIAMEWQSTAEVLRAYHKVGEDAVAGILPAKAFMNAENSKKVEALARKVIMGSEAGDNVSALVTELIQLQNIDSGFGDQAHYHSRVIDTAFALNALSFVQVADARITGYAVNYLKSQQSAEGGFSHSSKNNDTTYETALALLALQKYQSVYNLTAELNKGTQYLLSNQVASGGWDSNWESAYALLAIELTAENKAGYQAATNILKAAQLSNGSWDNEVYTTALVIRALYKAENALRNQD